MGTLTTIQTSEGTIEHRHGHIKINKGDLPSTIAAYYKDAYGRFFESKRAIKLAEDQETAYLDALEHRKLNKDEESALIKNIWYQPERGGNS